MAACAAWRPVLHGCLCCMAAACALQACPWRGHTDNLIGPRCVCVCMCVGTVLCTVVWAGASGEARSGCTRVSNHLCVSHQICQTACPHAERMLVQSLMIKKLGLCGRQLSMRP